MNNETAAFGRRDHAGTRHADRIDDTFFGRPRRRKITCSCLCTCRQCVFTVDALHSVESIARESNVSCCFTSRVYSISISSSGFEKPERNVFTASEEHLGDSLHVSMPLTANTDGSNGAPENSEKSEISWNRSSELSI